MEIFLVVIDVFMRKQEETRLGRLSDLSLSANSCFTIANLFKPNWTEQPSYNIYYFQAKIFTLLLLS